MPRHRVRVWSGEVGRGGVGEAGKQGFEARARRAFAEAARAAGLTASFEVARGSIVAAAVNLAEDDLLVVEGAMLPFAGEIRMESRWRG